MYWEDYFGPTVSPKEYIGNLETIKRDLTELWGDPCQGNDYLSPDEIEEIARELVKELF